MKRLYRSRRDRKIAGICGGLGEYLDLDPTLIRLIMVFLGFLTGLLPAILAYLISWAIIPLEPVDKEAQKSEG